MDLSARIASMAVISGSLGAATSRSAPNEASLLGPLSRLCRRNHYENLEEADGPRFTFKNCCRRTGGHLTGGSMA